MTSMIEFASNGGVAEGYLALPPNGSGSGVLVIQEWWGLVPHIKDVADRFAAAGFVALAPDLYHGSQADEPDEAAKMMMQMSIEQAGKDLSGALDALAERSGGSALGVVGFCMGGGLAIVVGCQRPDLVKAVVPFYGAVPWPDAPIDYTRLSAPVLGHYAEKDGWATPAAAEELATALRAAGNTDVTIHVYPGTDHAFFNDTRPEVYDEAASKLAMARTVEFFHRHLG
jgi:carboxymethylenebutenolidase